MMTKTLFATATFVACVVAGSAGAVPYQSATAPTTVPGTTTINFNSAVANGTLLSNQFAGVTLTNLYKTNDYANFPNFSEDAAGNFGLEGTSAGPVVTIDFDKVVSSAIVNYLSNPGTSTFSTFLNGTLVETGAFATGTDGKFTGFQNSAFNRLTLNAARTSNAAFVIDNLSFSPIASAVPEPASWAMMIVGIGAAGGGLRRRKGKVAMRVAFS